MFTASAEAIQSEKREKAEKTHRTTKNDQKRRKKYEQPAEKTRRRAIPTQKNTEVKYKQKKQNAVKTLE